MKDLSTLTRTHKNQLAAEAPFVWFFEFETTDDPPERFRLTNYTSNLNFGTNTAGEPVLYYAAPVEHGSISEESDGSLPTLEIFVGNATLEITTRFEQMAGMIGQPARVQVVSLLELANTAAAIRFDGEIVASAMTPQVITLSIAAYNVYRETIPPFVYAKRHCRWIFGGPECGYVVTGGGFSTCPKTLTACKARGDNEVALGRTRLHPARFGAHPGIPPLGRGA